MNYTNSQHTTIDCLGLTTRAYNALRRHKIDTVEQLMKMTDEELNSISNLGSGSMKDIKKCLKQYVTGEIEEIEEDSYNFVDWNVKFVSYIFPETAEREYVLRFKDEYGVVKENIEINDLGLSLKIKRGLHMVNCFTLMDLMNTKCKNIIKSFNIGKKSLEKIVEIIKPMVVVQFVKGTSDKDLYDLAQVIYDDIHKYFLTGTSYEHIFRTLKSMGEVVTEKMPIYKNKELFLEDETVMSLLYKDEKFLDALESVVKSALKRNPEGLKREEIAFYMPKGSCFGELLKKTLEQLVKKKEIEIWNNKYVFCFERITDYVSWLDDLRQIKILSRRLAGETLEDIGQSFDITRERTRQIIKAVLQKAPCFYEDRYRYWFEKYSFTPESFCSIFNEPLTTYHYLRNVCDMGEIEVDTMQEDEYMTDTLRESLTTFLQRDLICVEGEIVYCSRRAIVNALLKQRHSKEPCHLKEIRSEYEEFCKENGLDDFSFDGKVHNAFENFLNRNESRNILESQGKYYRYYDIDSYDIPPLISQIDFQSYDGCVIAAHRLYEDYKELMDTYNIANGYELHNLLKKHSELVPSNIMFDKMPYIRIGETDRAAQVKQMYKELTPSSLEEFAEAFYQKYGVQKNTFISNWSKFIYE